MPKFVPIFASATPPVYQAETEALLKEASLAFNSMTPTGLLDVNIA